MQVEILKETPINGITYFKGDTVSVSSSIRQKLLDAGEAKDYVKPTSKKSKNSDTKE